MEMFMDDKKPKKKRFTTSKMILAAMIGLIFIICFFAMFEMHRLNDLSQLYALIGIVATLAPVIWAYYSKAKAENTEGGITYTTALLEDYGIIPDEPEEDNNEC